MARARRLDPHGALGSSLPPGQSWRASSLRAHARRPAIGASYRRTAPHADEAPGQAKILPAKAGPIGRCGYYRGAATPGSIRKAIRLIGLAAKRGPGTVALVRRFHGPATTRRSGQC